MKIRKTIRHGVAALAITLFASLGVAAPAGRYVIANGTVQDTKTGLVWQQTINGASMVLADAKAYCATVGSGQGGTWRVPTVKELMTIFDTSQTGSAPTFLDPDAFPGPAEFWSSTLLAGSTTTVWYVNFYGGPGIDGPVGGPHTTAVTTMPGIYVRCVQ